jgi:hypothetical protein
MIIFIETCLSLLLLIAGTKIGEFYSDSLYEVHLSNGNIVNIKTSKENLYSCPIQCNAYHFHSTVISKYNNKNSYIISYINKKSTTKLNDINIEQIYKLKIEKKNTKKNRTKKSMINTEKLIKRYKL